MNLCINAVTCSFLITSNREIDLKELQNTFSSYLTRVKNSYRTEMNEVNITSQCFYTVSVSQTGNRGKDVGACPEVKHSAISHRRV